MSEIWKPVPGYEGFYSVSNYGNVKSERRIIAHKDGKQRTVYEKVLSQYNGASGHKKVDLTRNGVRKKCYVHRLVLEAFVGPCPDGMEACHWNDNPADNSIENLRWDTQSQNTFDRVRNGKHPAARKTHCIRGHEFTANNTVPNGNGRNCRICTNAAKRARRLGVSIENILTGEQA